MAVDTRKKWFYTVWVENFETKNGKDVHMVQKKKKVNLLTKVLVTAFAVYAAFTMVSLRVKIEDMKDTQSQLKRELELQQLLNAELYHATSGGIDRDYIAKLAREDLGYIFPGELVFQDISSK